MARTILLIGALDTMGAALLYARAGILGRGHDVLLLDIGTGEPAIGMDESAVTPDLTGSAVARAGGVELVVPRLHAEHAFAGVLGVGGHEETNVATAAMRALPVGVPKLMVSTVAPGDMGACVGVRDITMMPAVVDLRGLTRVSRRIIANAAGAICGMVEQDVPAAAERPMVAATMFGVTTPCVTAVRAQLEQAGYEVLVFHATGTGGRAMEGLIEDDCFVGVVDLTTTEWCDEVVGGLRSAGPDRLGAAGRAGIPQVVSVGALDMVNFAGIETVPARWRGRNLYRHNPNATLMRTTAGECAEIARRIAHQLNQAIGPAVLMLPLRGVSMIDAPGQPFHDPDADRALFAALRALVASHITVVDVDAHINDPQFAEAVVTTFLRLMAERPHGDGSVHRE